MSQTEAIKQIEQRRLDALVAGDFETLDKLLSERLEFIHPTGKLDTKESYIAQLRIRNPYVSIHPVDQTILTLGDTAVVTGETHTVAFRDPPEPNVNRKIRLTCVWTREGDDWRVVRYQSTFIP